MKLSISSDPSSSCKKNRRKADQIEKKYKVFIHIEFNSVNPVEKSMDLKLPYIYIKN